MVRSIAISIVILCSMNVLCKDSLYPAKQAPLVESQFIELPLGHVKPAGWLHDQLTVQAKGLTGHLDEFWESLQTSNWKGGDGETWERGPYYLDGLVPLAYQLDGDRLKDKVQVWMDWILASGQPNGWFGPDRNKDRWPLAVALKVLAQYYEATGDERALTLIENYFRYLHDNPPDWPQDTWRGVRAMENAVTGYWLYRRTGDPEVLETIESIFTNSFDWSGFWLDFPWTAEAIRQHAIPLNWHAVGLTAHVVNIAMAVKYPALWYQQSADPKFKKAFYQAIHELDTHHGQVAGRFSGDEHIFGKRPTQGSELCSVVEFMFSLENALALFGDSMLADRLEMSAYNSIPGTCTADFWAHQYDQQANQVLCTSAKRDWSTNGNDSNLYGLEPNFGCCTSNMHQGWPKFVSHLWMATPDRGLAATAYGPSTVTAKVADGIEVTVKEETGYPFKEVIRFTIETSKPVSFPLYFRVPQWAKHAEIKLGDDIIAPAPGQYFALKREWKNGDTVSVKLPMDIRMEHRYNNAVAVYRGPLVYSLQIGTELRKIKSNSETFPSADWELHPATPWNFALILDAENPEKNFNVIEKQVSTMPFDPKYPPVIIEAKGKQLPNWGMDGASAADPPRSPVQSNQPVVNLQLVPYGSAPLRITEFPYIRREM